MSESPVATWASGMLARFICGLQTALIELLDAFRWLGHVLLHAA